MSQSNRKEVCARYYRNHKARVTKAILKWRRENPETYSASVRAAYARNPEKFRARARRYHTENRDSCKAKLKIYYRLNREKCQKRQLEFYRKNLEACRAKNRAWIARNKDEYLRKRREREKLPEVKAARCAKLRLRRQNDPKFKIETICRTRIRAALKAGTRKSAKTFALLGCTIEQFKLHLESYFLPGMHWNNHGPVWEIDHIIPVAAFDLTKPSHQQYCFHYSNQRPLWSELNRKKRCRVTADQLATIRVLP